MPGAKNCTATATEVYGRGNTVLKILTRLGRPQIRPAFRYVKEGSGVVLAFYGGSEPLATSYRDWRFPTCVSAFYGQYFERWLNADEVYHLDRAYLHVFRVSQVKADEEEIVALHCDPNVAPEEPHASYRLGPHIHVVKSEHPLPRAHISLNKLHLDSVLASLADLTLAIEGGVLLVKEQILDLYSAA